MCAVRSLGMAIVSVCVVEISSDSVLSKVSTTFYLTTARSIHSLTCLPGRLSVARTSRRIVKVEPSETKEVRRKQQTTAKPTTNRTDRLDSDICMQYVLVIIHL